MKDEGTDEGRKMKVKDQGASTMNDDERDEAPPPSPPSSFILHPSSFRLSGLHPSLHDAVAAARAKVRVGYPWWLRPLLARDVVAITLGRRIYVRGMLESASFERLLRHELAHVRQVERLGLMVFLWRYVVEFARNWVRLRSVAAAYAAISFEIEARDAEEDDS